MFMSYKTNLSKAYDQVEWCVLEALMLKTSFSKIKTVDLKSLLIVGEKISVKNSFVIMP